MLNWSKKGMTRPRVYIYQYIYRNWLHEHIWYNRKTKHFKTFTIAGTSPAQLYDVQEKCLFQGKLP